MSEKTFTDSLKSTRLGTLRVRVTGTGPPSVLWHSLFVDSTTWERVREGLAQHRQLLMIDGPSHGGSEPITHRFTPDDCAGAAGDLLEQLGVGKPVDWIGNAWGGHVGLAFAASRPGDVRSLVTIGTPVRALNVAERRQIAVLLPIYRLIGPVLPVVRALGNALLGARCDPRDARLVADAFRRANRAGMANAVRSASLGRPDITDVLPNVVAPTLMVTGQDDTMWTPAEARDAAAQLPSGACVIVPGAGHVAPLLQSAAAMIELIEVFWRDPAAFVAREAQAIAAIEA